LSQEEKEVIRKIEHTIEKMKLDGSSGAHNFMFIEDTLINLERELESVAKATD